VLKYLFDVFLIVQVLGRVVGIVPRPLLEQVHYNPAHNQFAHLVPGALAVFGQSCQLLVEPGVMAGYNHPHTKHHLPFLEPFQTVLAT